MIAIGNYCMSAEITHVPKKNSEGTRKKGWMMSECEHEWHIEGRDIFVQCWHNLEHTLTVEQVETMLNEHAKLEAERDDYRTQYHMAEAKITSRDALLEQLSEEQLTQDLAKAEEENDMFQELFVYFFGEDYERLASDGQTNVTV